MEIFGIARHLEITEQPTKSEINFFSFCEKLFKLINYFLSRYVTVIKATIYYFLPLSIIAILYTLMARKLQHSAKEVQTIAGKNNPQAQSRR